LRLGSSQRFPFPQVSHSPRAYRHIFCRRSAQCAGRVVAGTSWQHGKGAPDALPPAPRVQHRGLPRSKPRIYESLRPDAFEPEDIEDLKANTHNPDFEMLYQEDADGRALPAITEDCFEAFARHDQLTNAALSAWFGTRRYESKRKPRACRGFRID
jgi:hypothetical protein